MKKKILFNFLVVFAIAMLTTESLAQTIIDIPTEYKGSQYGVINRFILDDTLATGGRAHPNAIYRLAREGYYDVDFPMVIDFNFTLIGADEPKEERPAMLSRGIDAQGNYVTNFIILRGDSINIKFENILFNGMQDDGEIVNRGGSLFRISGTHNRFIFNKCIFHGWGGNLMNHRDNDLSTYIFTNNIFRNIVDLDNPWGGNIFSHTTKAASMDSVIFRDNTFFNVGSYQFLNWTFDNYTIYEHNTIFNATINAHWAPFLANAKVNNNIFYNYQTVGQTEYERNEGYWDLQKHLSSICKLDPMDPQILLDHGMTEADRNVEYKNNVYFWSQGVKDYWATAKDSSTGQELDILPITFMNATTQAMFDDDASYPHLVAENNIEADPGFDADLVAAVWAKERPFVVNYRRHGVGALVDPKERMYAPDGIFWDIDWPLPESLRYTNEALKTYSTDGDPVGDRNWWPEIVGVEKINTTIPSEYTLSQNYPNPFNPTTEMSFAIPVSGNTTLSIYNVLGQKVATLVNKELQAGSYKYQFDASNLTSGIYFYKLESSNYSQVKKMMLLK